MTNTVAGGLIYLIAFFVLLVLGWLALVTGARMKSGTAKDTILECIAAAGVVVRHLAQTLRPELVKLDGGKLSDASIAQLRDTALADLKSQVADQTLKVLRSNHVRLDEVLIRLVEAEVHTLKISASMPPPPPLPELGTAAP